MDKLEEEEASNRCPGCSGPNRCGIAASGPCWCAAEVTAKLPVPPAGASCYCKACLEALLAQAAVSGPAGPAPSPGG